MFAKRYKDVPSSRLSFDLVNEPLGLADLHIAQSCCAYQLMTLTLHRVVLDWMSDVMDVLQGYNIGYALWNFRGQFGILDSQRKDCRYEDWRGHLLDRQMLEILKAH